MADLTFTDILAMQRRLQAAHAHEWTALAPENGRDTLLWLIGEVSEVADIIKKRGDNEIMTNDTVRIHFIEELADVLMYFGDVLLTYGIGAEDIAAAYHAKHERNMTRDFSGENQAMFGGGEAAT